jgi:hypothetical protein
MLPASATMVMWVVSLLLGVSAGPISPDSAQQPRSSAPPEISLDLASISMPRRYDGSMAGLGCNGFNTAAMSSSDPTCRPRFGVVHGSSHSFSEDYAKVCVAKQDDSTHCPLPSAQAYDHHQGLINVTTNIYLVNLEGTVPPNALTRTYAAIDYSSRSEWLLKYDAEDRVSARAHAS